MLNVVSLFSGGGGLDLGFISAGYNVIWASDIDKNAVATYKKNIGNHIICGDINHIDINTIPKADVLIGGPACQSFSLAGNRDIYDIRGQLVWNYVEILKHVEPKAFVFENVQGLLSSKNNEGEKVIDLIIKAFKELGYTLSVSVLNSADYGVPQKRKRVIIVGLKGDVTFNFPLPTHNESGIGLKKYVSIEEALYDLPNAINDPNGLVQYKTEPQSEYQKLMRKNNGDTVSEHFISKLSELDKYIISYVKPGGNYRDLPDDIPSKRVQKLKETGGRTTYYGRLVSEKASYTINTNFNRPNMGCNIHPIEDRLISVREALRLQSFPDDYVIVSTSKQGRNKIVGNAVPPLLAEVLAKELKNYI